MFTKSLDYPRRGPEAVKTIAIGGILLLVSFLFVPMLILTGYVVRVARNVLDGDERPPVFGDWSRLLVDGSKGWLITLAYFLLPGLVLVGTAIAGVLSFDGSPGRALASGSIFVLGLLVASLLGLIAWYVATAGFVNFARTGRIGDAFAFGDLKPILFSGSYATAWVLAFAVLVGAGIVTAVLDFVPIVGFLAGVFVTFYATISATYLYARGFDDATELESVRETPAEDIAA